VDQGVVDVVDAKLEVIALAFGGDHSEWVILDMTGENSDFL
jgi:hypothetical protein